MSDDDINAIQARLSSYDSDGFLSDADIDAVTFALEELERTGPDFKKRGKGLTKYMRACKKTNAGNKDKLAKHVQDQIKTHNVEHAKSKRDLIIPEERKPRTIPGKGVYKQWLPEALQRACWGLRPLVRAPKKPRKAVRRIRGKQAAAHMPAPSTGSSRMFAVFNRANHTHVQKVRDGMAEKYMRVQEILLKAEGHADTMILQCALDATQEPVQLSVRGGQEYRSTQTKRLKIDVNIT